MEIKYNSEELANAIVIQATTDYIRTRVAQKEARNILKQANDDLKELCRFFNSEWYAELSKIDPMEILEVCEIKAEYTMWRKNKKCGGCKHENCAHKWGLYGWKKWHDGERTCIRQK